MEYKKNNNKVRFGFIGAGLIARTALAPAIKNSDIAELYITASRDIDRAFSLGAIKEYTNSYEYLINSPNIEAVYISLPNSLHIPWSIKAMQAGKHVLCEKPIAMNAQELKEAIKVSESTGKLLMEASWNRWHPRTKRIKELIDSKEIGDITHIYSTCTYSELNDINNIRTTPELGGGSLYDLGPYSIAVPFWLLDFKPIKDIETEVTWHPDGCDETLISRYKIGNVNVVATTSMNVTQTEELIIEGTEGKIYTNSNDAFFSYNLKSSLTIEKKHDKIILEEFAACDPYQIMLDSFAEAVSGKDSWLMPLSESLKFAQLFDQIRENINEQKE